MSPVHELPPALDPQAVWPDLPKAELHVHLEGTAHPDLVRAKAAEKGRTLDPALFDESGGYGWASFREFLDSYDRAASVFTTPEDYRDLTHDYLARSHAEGAIYTEIMVSPDHGAANGLDYGQLIGAVAEGIERARTELRIEARMLITAVRHYEVANAEAVARQAVRAPHPLVVGFGLAGDETRGDLADFARAFAIAHEEGGLACHCHAGEAAGPESVAVALDHLPVRRIGHGVRAIEDPALVARLAAERVTLEVCPSSNVAIGVYDGFAAHPLRQLAAAGVPVTLGSDDPPFFHTTIGTEYRRAAAHFGFDRAALAGITRTALQAAFCDSATRRALTDKLDQLAAAAALA